MYDIGIIGAGPIGSYIAHEMSKLGYSVLVLEKKAYAGQDVCCTGIVGRECFDLLHIDNKLVARKANSATFFSPSKRSLTLQRDDDVAYILDRPLLNEQLRERAQASGSDYFFSCPVTDIEITDTEVRLFTFHGTTNPFKVRIVVLATGGDSKLPQKLGLGRINRFTVGAQAEVEINDIHGIEIYVDQSLTPGSFAWLVPTRNNKGYAGLMVDKQPKTKLHELLSQLFRSGKIGSADVKCACAAIPLQPHPTTVSDRVLIVGEAAGHIKPITGGGIFFGLLGADMAVTVLHNALFIGDASRKQLYKYQQDWKTLLDREIRMGLWMRQLWSILNNRQVECLFTIAGQKRLAKFIATSDEFSFDWHGRLLFNSLKLMLPFP